MDEREQDSTVVSFIGQAKETIAEADESAHADDAAAGSVPNSEK